MNCINTWTIKIGGMTKNDLLIKLDKASIQINEYAKTLFKDECFITSETSYEAHIVEISVEELGLKDGGYYSDIVAKASEQNLELCPLELAPHFRLQYTNQPQGPYLTIASKKTRNDESYPNGFYLRKLEGILWLRGYRSTSDWLWEADSRFVFIKD